MVRDLNCTIDRTLTLLGLVRPWSNCQRPFRCLRAREQGLNLRIAFTFFVVHELSESFCVVAEANHVFDQIILLCLTQVRFKIYHPKLFLLISDITFN